MIYHTIISYTTMSPVPAVLGEGLPPLEELPGARASRPV